MVRKQVWQYRCDFCGKRGLSGGHMKAHEKHCTANPERICRFHKHCEDPVQPNLRLVMDALWQGGLEKAREVSVASCILAALLGLCKGHVDEEGYVPPKIEYNFKAEMQSKWSDINNAKEEERAYA